MPGVPGDGCLSGKPPRSFMFWNQSFPVNLSGSFTEVFVSPVEFVSFIRYWKTFDMVLRKGDFIWSGTVLSRYSMSFCLIIRKNFFKSPKWGLQL